MSRATSLMRSTPTSPAAGVCLKRWNPCRPRSTMPRLNCMRCVTRKDRPPLLVLLLVLLTPQPDAWTQFPRVPPPGLTGSTLGQNIHNAAAATRTQLAALNSAIDNWRRRAQSANYTADYFQEDFA